MTWTPGIYPALSPLGAWSPANLSTKQCNVSSCNDHFDDKRICSASWQGMIAQLHHDKLLQGHLDQMHCIHMANHAMQVGSTTEAR